MTQYGFIGKHYLNESVLYYYFLHIILFFYIYSIQFIGVPFGIGTRVFLGVLGFLYFISEIVIKGKTFNFDRRFFSIFASLFLICFVSMVSLIYNGTKDVEFLLKYPVSIIIIVFASYFVTKLTLFIKDEDRFSILIDLCINVVLFQSILSVLMFLNSPLRDFLNSIQINSELELRLLEETIEFRLVGFGAKFFEAGYINGFALMLIATMIKWNDLGRIKVLKYAIIFLVIFVLGMMMARTTIIGFLLAIIILFWPNGKKNKLSSVNRSKFLLYILIISIIVIIVVFYMFPELKESFELAFNFGFEMFINYFDSGRFESISTNKLEEMYVWPSSVKTYIIGDGLYTDVINGTYYMKTDVGFLRLIYYFGIIGMLSYFIFQFQMAYAAFLNNYKFRYTFVLMFVYCLVLSYKGFTDLFYLNIIFFINKKDNLYIVKN